MVTALTTRAEHEVFSDFVRATKSIIEVDTSTWPIEEHCSKKRQTEERCYNERERLRGKGFEDEGGWGGTISLNV
jgi:hypothetical protein